MFFFFKEKHRYNGRQEKALNRTILLFSKTLFLKKYLAETNSIKNA